MTLALVDNLPKHIKKGHQLVFSHQDLSAREADLFGLMMAYMHVDDWQDKTPDFNFPCAKLSEWLKIESRHVGTVLSPIADRLSQRKVGIESLNKKGEVEFEHVPLFKRIQYKNSVLKIIPNDELKAEYIEYHKGFALINTANFLGLKKEYTKRLYEILSRFKSGGTGLQILSIESLKGLFGILDENGKLKKDKQSFASTGVFMKRCIRESIHELQADPETSKELLFISSEKSGKDIGFEVEKIGNRIVGVKFLYRWISNKTPVENLNKQSAEQTIRELEFVKKLQNKERLTDEELEILAASYRVIGKEDLADNVIKSLVKRQEQDQQETDQSESIEKLLQKIETMKEVNGDIEY